MPKVTDYKKYFQGKYTENFSSKVLQKLKTSRKTIAYDLDVSRSTYDNWYYGIYAFPPDLLSRLIKLVEYKEDRNRILNFLLFHIGYMAIRIPSIELKNLSLEIQHLKTNAMLHFANMNIKILEARKRDSLKKLLKSEAKAIISDAIEIVKNVCGIIQGVRQEADLEEDTVF